uniref:Integrase catalytic domain-containing protein n=1 Tax=Tanacetum cinerariifolium TaxID=118510 RepID=A0A699H2E6_TANCI|nr:hypothetical protein [Tanacetum cinerariifolium]
MSRINYVPLVKWVKQKNLFQDKVCSKSKGQLNLLHMDLCGLMRVASINGKKYILVIVDDYSEYTWSLFLCSKDETPEVLKDFLTMIQRNLQAPVISVRTDRGTKFLNKTLHAFFKEKGMEHQTSTPRTPEQNGIFKRQNYTLVEAARTMLSALKLPLFFWAEAITTACYTQNTSIIISTYDKKAYHIINDRKPSIKHLYIFGCTCHLTRDGENLDKMKEKGDPCILVGYSTQLKGYHVYNKRTRLIVESIHLKFNEMKEMSETSLTNDISDTTVPSQQELNLLFGPLYDEFFNAGTSSVNKSSSPTKNSKQRDTPPITNIQSSTEPTNPTNADAEENNDNQAEDEFTNPFCTSIREVAKYSSQNIGNSNVHTFNQTQVSEYRWIKDHPLEQVRENPSKPMQTRQQLATDPKMCMFALTEVYVAQQDGFVNLDHRESLPTQESSIWIETSSKSMAKYALEILKKHGMEKGQSIGTPMATKPKLDTDLSGNPYTKLTTVDSSFDLTAFLDADHVGCIDTRKGTSGGIQFLGAKLFSWMSKKHDCTAMSSAEAEYMALSASCAQKKRIDQEGVVDEGFSDVEEANNDDKQETFEIFRIETNLFDYETPLCTEFKEFNFLLKVDLKLFTRDIERTKTYEDYENKLNDKLEEPWSEDGVPYEMSDHIYEPFRFKIRKSKWPT